MASDLPPGEQPTEPQWTSGWPGQTPSAPGPYAGYPLYRFAPPLPTAAKRGAIPWYVWLIGGCLGLLAIVVIGCVVLAGIFAGLGLQLFNQQSASETTTQTLPISGVPTLDIQDGSGRVIITQGTSNQVRVQITRTARASSQQDAQSALKSIAVTVAPQGNTITIKTVFAAGAVLYSTDEVDLTISTPHETQVSVTGTTTTVEVDHISGLVQVSLDQGNITTNGVTFANGSRLEIQTGNAALQGTLAAGASLDVQVDAGNVNLSLPAGTPARLNASVNNGSIAVNGWPITPAQPSGNGAGATATGNLGTNPSGTITVQVNDGNITLTAD